MNQIARRAAELAPLSDDLSPQVRAWVQGLRDVFTGLDMPMTRFARLHPINKGTVSRYLNGKRVPADRWFLDRILAMRASAGTPVTEEVRTHLIELQMAALKVAHPYEYKVRKVKDELEIAVTSWKEAERYARDLEAQLHERTQQASRMIAEADQLRTAWNEDTQFRLRRSTREPAVRGRLSITQELNRHRPRK